MQLLQHSLHSLYHLILGYLGAVLLGIPLGALISSAYLPPWLPELIMGVPTIAWLPLLVVLLGLGSAPVIAAVFLGALFSIVLTTANALRHIDPDIIGAASLDGATGLPLLIQIKLPCSRHSILAGLRTAAGYSWRALIGAEMFAVLLPWGLGKFIWQARFWSDRTSLLLGLGIIMTLGTVSDAILRVVSSERRA